MTTRQPSPEGLSFPPFGGTTFQGGVMNSLEQGQLALLQSILEQRLAALAGVAELQEVGGSRDLPVSEVETSPADKATVRLLNDLALEAAGHNAAQMQK